MIDYRSLDSAIGHDWYELDPALQGEVRRGCPPEDLEWVDARLHDLGTLVGGPVARNAEIIDANPPQLVRYDKWANEVNEVAHHPAALESKGLLWRAGYVSGFAADEKKHGRPAPAVLHGASSYLLSEADTGMVCSLGMTSGVAGLVAAYAPADVRDDLLSGLRADDLDTGVDGSMFLTERDGGSDLGRSVHCSATDIGDGRVLISGEKWFCSNIDGAAIVMLARPEGAPDGPQGLGLYLVPRRLDDGSLNHYSMRRLKPKLGTKSVPTGEVEFHEALGYALRPRKERDGGGSPTSDAGGLGRMMEMVNGSRFGVAMMGMGIARRCLLESAIWAHHREAKGRLLVDLPLVREQLVDLATEVEAALAFGFACSTAARLEDGIRLRRILVPAAKVRLCRLGVEAASATIELYGGNGYCEDWGLTRQLRDAQCHPIWEGSENICAIDVLRAIRRDSAHEAVFTLLDAIGQRAAALPSYATAAVEAVARGRRELDRRIDALAGLEPDAAEAKAGQLTELLVRTVSTALLLDQAVTDGDHRKALLAVRSARRHLDAGSRWDDGIAQSAGREILAFDQVDEATATQAAA
ncbi:MAG: acyl-CoA dehydrogenase [Actinomycetota bacterium]|jgi:alkylation response protein AidB-like acyl-CoA dehydrogenase|nr:acyl-CoA dehydrogenase [Actinomycetota bacterium]